MIQSQQFPLLLDVLLPLSWLIIALSSKEVLKRGQQIFGLRNSFVIKKYWAFMIHDSDFYLKPTKGNFYSSKFNHQVVQASMFHPAHPQTQANWNSNPSSVAPPSTTSWSTARRLMLEVGQPPALSSKQILLHGEVSTKQGSKDASLQATASSNSSRF
jgi:hypothetical protein